jgi:RNA polymerase sigma-70 factor (ECF subfamily)
MNEAEIIEGCKKGDRKSQEQLYREFSRKMFGICLGYAKDEDDAKDILQEGFIKVFHNIHQFNGEGALGGWVRRIIVNTAIDKYRQSAKIFTISLDISAGQPEPTDNSILDRIDSDELLELIHNLPEGSRLIFNLFAVEGYKHKEIAEMLNISEGTSKSQLHEAKRILQKKIESIYGKSIKYYARRIFQVVQ